VAEGVSLHALVWEGAAERPFLLVHGLSSNCRTWEAVAARLHAAGHAVAAVDLRGHGRSDKPDEAYDFATFTSDLRAVIGGLAFDRPVAVGQSTGGNLAVELAAYPSGFVAGVVGIDGGLIELSTRWPRWEDCESALAPPRLAGTPVTEVRRWIEKAHPDWSEAGIEATLANLEVLADGTVRPWLTYDRHIRLLRALWEHRPSQVVPTLDVPALFLHADHLDGDHGAAPPHAMVTGRGVAVERLAGDHDLHVQQPGAVADRLLRFASYG